MTGQSLDLYINPGGMPGMSPVSGSSHRFITTFYSFYHQMYSVCRRKHFKGELSLSGDILMGFLYTGQSIHFRPISSKSSYFTLISASSKIDSKTYLICFTSCVLLLIRLISNIPFHQKFICNSLSLWWSEFDI